MKVTLKRKVVDRFTEMKAGDFKAAFPSSPAKDFELIAADVG